MKLDSTIAQIPTTKQSNQNKPPQSSNSIYTLKDTWLIWKKTSSEKCVKITLKKQQTIETHNFDNFLKTLESY